MRKEYQYLPIHEITQSSAEDELRRYRALWRAVINQLFVDAFSTTRKKRNFKFKRMARGYVRTHNPHFLNVCELAYFDAKTVADHFRRLERERLN